MSILIKWLSRVLISFLLLTSLVILVSYHFASRSLPKYNQSLISDKIKNNVSMYVPETVRFRKEDNFYLLNIRWGNTIEITNEEGKFLLEKQKNKEKFKLSDVKFKNALIRLSGFVAKEALKSEEIVIEVRKTGVNIDPAKLPDLNNPELLKSHPNIKL